MAVLNLRGRFELADVALDDLVDGWGRVEYLVDSLAGQWRSEDDAGAVAACFRRLQADGFDAAPDLGNVLHLDPVVLHVLAIRQVRGVTRELL